MKQLIRDLVVGSVRGLLIKLADRLTDDAVVYPEPPDFPDPEGCDPDLWDAMYGPTPAAIGDWR